MVFLLISSKEHVNYAQHQCETATKKDFKIPVCPLCNQPVPLKRNEVPDYVISAHIDRDCKSDPAEERRRQIFNYSCAKKGCKQKEVLLCFPVWIRLIDLFEIFLNKS
jgi:hypothetical protein